MAPMAGMPVGAAALLAPEEAADAAELVAPAMRLEAAEL